MDRRKRRTRRLSLFAAAALLLTWGGYRMACGLPFNIKHWADRAMAAHSISDPELVSVAGLVDNTVLDFHSDKLSDSSPAGRERFFDWAQSSLDQLREYERDDLDTEGKLTYDVMEWYFEDLVSYGKFAYHSIHAMNPSPYPVNHLLGVQSHVPNFMDQYHRVVDEESGERYIARLEKVGTKFDQVIESLEQREKHGVIPPKFVIDRVLAEMNKFVSAEPKENLLYLSLVKKLDKAKDEFDDEAREELLTKTEETIRDEVYPAYKKLIEFVEDQRSRATDDEGVWKFPDGADYYKRLIRSHTTVIGLTAEEIHRTGLSEIKRIEGKMAAILTKLGYEFDSIGDQMRKLSHDPRFLYEDSEEGRKQIIEDYRGMLDRIQVELPKLFDEIPDAPLDVQAVPKFQEEGMAHASYTFPSMDGSRQAVFLVNLHNIDGMPNFLMPTLALHEGFPGHHFQISLSIQNDELPFLRKGYPFSAHSEGWALYVESLATSLGFKDDPYADLGRLHGELWRAVRLVVDTGLHHYKWSRTRATDYMEKILGLPREDVLIEVDRYIVMPGQALGYTIGLMKMRELRKNTEARLGDKFNIKEFHALCTKSGTMPLHILERYVNEYIETKLEE